MSRNFYLRSVHKRWKQALTESEAQVIVCSPYLTPKAALTVIQSASPKRCTIYTRFSLEDFASGASSLRVLASLLKDGYSVFEIQALHAKIVLASEEFASIGSQNLTARGIKNREATYCTDDRSEVDQVEQMLAPWLESATPITTEMVEHAMQLLPPIEHALRAVQEAAATAEAAVRAAQKARAASAHAAQAARDATLRLEEQRRAEEAEAVRMIATLAREYIDRRTPRWTVSLELAKSFVRRSAWWHSHPSGPVRAPAHAKRITSINGEWQVSFGANSFLVSRAIFHASFSLRKYIDGWEAGEPENAASVVTLLRLHVNGSVAGYNGSRMNSYPMQGNDMMFGTQSIDVRDFVRVLLEGVPAEISQPLIAVNEAKVGF